MANANPKIRLLAGEENPFCCLTAAFWPGAVLLGGRVLAAGELSTALLNTLPEELAALAAEGEALARYAGEHFFRPSPLPRDYPAFRALQEKLNHLLDGLAALPPYNRLPGSTDFARTLLMEQYRQGPAAVRALADPRTEEYRLVTDLFSQLAKLPAGLAAFQQAALPMAAALEPFAHRTPESYAAAVAGIGYGGAAGTGQAAALPVQLRPVALTDPETGACRLAEQLRFADPAALLQTDFLRGLMAGNAPRRCRSCGQFFLLTEGYNTCYCPGLAPGEESRTCRQVGAHRLAAEKPRSPARQVYDRFYNRLKTRKSRKTLSPAEAAAALREAKALLAQAEQGSLTPEALTNRLAAL